MTIPRRFDVRVVPLLLGAVLAASCGRTLRAAEKPNFIFIDIDDLGYADIEPWHHVGGEA